MSRVYVGNLQPYIAERDLENAFQVFGVLRSVWVSRRPPGYAFVEFDDRRDALDAIEELDGRNGWRVELSHHSKGGRGSLRNSEEMRCYECSEPGHFAGDRCLCGPSGHHGSSSPRYRQSPSHRCRSYSPPRRSPHYHRSGSPYGISNSTYRRSYGGQSPLYHGNYPPDSNGRSES